MRQILHGDIIAAARSLLRVPLPERAAAVSAMLYQAHSADKVMKRTGRPHKKWGNGSLLSAAGPLPKRAEPFAGDVDYLCAMQIILAALIDWRNDCRPSRRRYPG